MSSSPSNTETAPSSPTPAPRTQPLNNMQKIILESLTNAASTIHSGTAIITFAEGLYGKEPVSQAQNLRRNNEKVQGQNGWHGETAGHRALARAYNLLVETGEEGPAAELRTIALGRILRLDWDREVEAVKQGW